jgi:hypothetical protein
VTTTRLWFEKPTRMTQQATTTVILSYRRASIGAYVLGKFPRGLHNLTSSAVRSLFRGVNAGLGNEYGPILTLISSPDEHPAIAQIASFDLMALGDL